MKYVFVQLGIFAGKAKKFGLTLEDFRRIENVISQDAKAAPVMIGTHGLRKIRFAPGSSSGGKSGGIRVCYVVFDDIAYVYLVDLFAKNEKDNIGHDDRNKLAALIDRLKMTHAKRNES